MLGNTEDVLIYKRLWTKLLELVVRHIAATKQRHVELFCNRDAVCHVQSIHCVDCEAFDAVETSGVLLLVMVQCSVLVMVQVWCYCWCSVSDGAKYIRCFKWWCNEMYNALGMAHGAVLLGVLLSVSIGVI